MLFERPSGVSLRGGSRRKGKSNEDTFSFRRVCSKTRGRLSRLQSTVFRAFGTAALPTAQVMGSRHVVAPPNRGSFLVESPPERWSSDHGPPALQHHCQRCANEWSPQASSAVAVLKRKTKTHPSADCTEHTPNIRAAGPGGCCGLSVRGCFPKHDVHLGGTLAGDIRGPRGISSGGGGGAEEPVPGPGCMETDQRNLRAYPRGPVQGVWEETAAHLL